MTASPPNDKAMPDVIHVYAVDYIGGIALHAHAEPNPDAVYPHAEYKRADLQSERIKRLEDALRFYADGNNWHGFDWLRGEDQGHIARAVLEEGGK